MQVVRCLDLNGNARQRGEAHGEAMRDAIGAGVERWLERMTAVQPLDRDAFLDHIRTTTQFEQTVTQLTPDLMDEVRGIASGANLDVSTVFAFQLLDECWWLAAQLAQQNNAQESCSSLALRDMDGVAVAAQTMDLPHHYDGGQLLLRFTDPKTGIRQLVFTAAGLVGLNGLNSRRLAVCVNTLGELPSSRRGLPVAFVLRSLLARADLAGAVEFVEATQHASGQNYVLASPDGIADIEAGATATTLYQPQTAHVYHTNHQLTNPDTRNVTDINSIANSVKRFEAMNRFFERHPEPDLAGIKTLLASADGPICAPRAARHGFTFGACIMILDTSPTLHIAHGPPTASSFVQHSL